uniref:HTH cro/C1-type domain-containing protein n=1 Tax=Geladintestivirus 4 TaxID=3233136 RepID=A0AAU8MHA6_9CAUD
MASCPVTPKAFLGTETGTRLKELCGNDVVKFNAITALVYNPESKTGFTKDFDDYRLGNDAAQEALEFYNSRHFSVGAQTTKSKFNNIVTRFGYTSTTAKVMANRVVGNNILTFFANDVVKGKFNKDNNNANFYANRVVSFAAVQVAKKYFENKGQKFTNKEILGLVNQILGFTSDASFKNVDDVFTNASKEDRNFYAMTKEMILNKVSFFNSIYAGDSRLGMLRFKSDEAIDEKVDFDGEMESILNGNENDELADFNKEFDVDGTTARWDDNSGMGNNFMKGIDEDIRMILFTIPKLNDINKVDGKYNYDRSNELGTIDFIDGKKVTAAIISKVSRDNITSFINSIKAIAEQNKEMSGLIKLYEDLKTNRDFAIRFRSQFVKTIMPKTETRTESDGTVRAVLSNKESNRRQSLIFSFQNNVKHTVLNVDPKAIEGFRSAVESARKRYKLSAKNEIRRNAAFADIVANLTKALKAYYLDMDTNAIRNYLIGNKTNGRVDVDINTSNLLAHLKNINDASNKANENLREEQEHKREWNKEGHDENETYVPLHTEIIPATAVAAANSFATDIEAYSTVALQFNSKNVLGNQSSDIINSSMITYLMNAINGTEMSVDAEGKLSPEALIQYGNEKFRVNSKEKGNQYNLSNILLEQRGVDGKIKVFGLFRKFGDKYVPTEYAKDLINVSLFNGAGNPNTGQNVLYSGMSKMDYIYSAVANFVNTEADYLSKNEYDIDFANYFMRVPSDAPKNFIIRAARYRSKGGKYGNLFNVENSKEVSQAIERYLDTEIPSETRADNEVKTAKFVNLTTNKEYNQMVHDLTTKTVGRRKIMPFNILEGKNHKSGSEIAVGYKYTDESGKVDRYELHGTLDIDSNGAYYITDAKPVLISDMNESKVSDRFSPTLYQSLVSKITRKANATGMIGNTKVNRVINTNHPLYIQYRNMFVQELTDMAHAINQWFETDNTGKILRWQKDENPELAGQPKFKGDWGFDEESARRAYAVYEVGKGHKHFVEMNDKTKTISFTGRLFHDDRFELTDKDGNVDNKAEDLLHELFPSLYGEDIDGYIPFTANGDKVTVTLSKKQEDKVAEMISNFITDYTNQQLEKFDAFKNIDVANIINDDNITDFVLNYRLMCGNFNDLFEGDTKFYKDNQTLLKRTKEDQASGVPYGFADYTASYADGISDVAFSQLNTNTIQTEFASYKNPLVVTQRNKFKGITIKNTIRTSEQCSYDAEDKTGKLTKKDGNLVRDLVKNAHLTVEQARTLMKGYSGTTVNDAQSYITFEEWVRRIAGRGKLNEYLPLIKKIQNDEPLSSSDIDTFVQVQKNFYYDHYFDKYSKRFVPRQIKNAEFVLVPRFIKGTQLEQVYNLMKDNGIDQLNTEETSKAGKARVLEIFDSKTGEVTQKHIDDFNAHAKDYVEEYDYQHLYTQQETPQHMNAENKAGIQIMKKIVDNIPVNSPLYKKKEEFFKLYSANIRDSFNNLANELSIPRDANGNILFEADGTIKGIDYHTFFNKLKEECMRLGLDSNMMDYVTLAEQAVNPITGRPNANMPMILSNAITKLESVSQSVFNRAITRQTLPGFHAAQITNVGFKATKEQISYSKELRYHPVTKEHPEGERYIEIMLPKSNFGFAKNEDGSYKADDDTLLKQLQKEGLDTLIGYRIPTEGKQSVCVMKVVGFLDDAQGSTIVVPDDWVSQTGSDFDIDSVYGIQYSSYIDKHGNIRKQSYSDELDIYDYANYVNRHLEKADKIKDKSVKAAFEQLNKEIDEQFEKSRKELSEEETKAYEALSDETKELVKNAHRDFESQAVKNKETGKLTKDSYLKQLQFVTDYIRINKTNLDDADNNFISVHEDMVDSISNEYIDKKNFKSDRAKAILQGRIDKFNNAAKKLGIMTYDEYLKQNVEDANTRNARNNRILDDMIDILKDDISLEENLSRSNFDDIINARDKVINPVVKKIRNARSSYDFLDQADYQEDVMSGAKLKAFSVTRDTFVSVCNTVHPTINNNYKVRIRYNYDGTKAGLKRLQDRFGKDNITDVDEENKTLIIAHDKIGWTNDNKNVDGRILTAYTSQTTAHILDAVKEGAIPNVNDFTFAVYKTLPDIGSNYDTTVAFIMQPAISRIVEEYNANKSIYAEDTSKPIHNAIKKLALEMNIGVTEDDSIRTVIDKVNSTLGTEYSLTSNNNVVLDYKELAARLNQKESRPVKDMVYDMSILFAYNDISRLAQGISSLARVCNPDRFGAKQTLFATNKVFTDIQEIVNGENANIENVLSVKDENKETSFLEAIYPGLLVENVTGNKSVDIRNYMMSKDNDALSKYPSLHCFLKYATATSSSINSMLFDTQTDSFKNLVYSLENTFSDRNRNINEKEYNNFQQYILSSVYNNSAPVMYASKVFVEQDGSLVYGFDNNSDVIAERQRIFGYNAKPQFNFDCEYINRPTLLEVEAFAKLTPAQKVAYLQSKSEDAGIFGLFKVNLFNQYEYNTTGQSKQSIQFKDDTTDVETAYMLFDQAANSDNPLVKLAAIDMIKYAFAVENFKMRRNGISKVITNDSLRNADLFGGKSAIDYIIDEFNNFAGTYDVAERYVRSHSDSNFIFHKTVKNVRKNGAYVSELSKFKKTNNLFVFNLADASIIAEKIANLRSEIENTTDENEINALNIELKEALAEYNNLKSQRAFAAKYGFINESDSTDDYYVNHYVHLNEKVGKEYKSRLYKIVENNDKVYAYPITKLDENETGEVSLNRENTKGCRTEGFYADYINSLEQGNTPTIEDLNEMAKAHKFNIKYLKVKNANAFDINHPSKYQESAAKFTINEILNKYPESNGKEFTIQSFYLRSKSIGTTFGNSQHIKGTYVTIEDGKEVNNEVDEIFEFRAPRKSEVDRAKDLGIQIPYNTYFVRVKSKGKANATLNTNSKLGASVLDFSIDAYNDMNRRSHEGDYAARKKVNNLASKGFNATRNEFQSQAEDVYYNITSYVEDKVNDITQQLNQFIEDETGHFLPVNNARTIDIIRNNPAERRRYLKTLLDARALISKYGNIASVKVDKSVDSDNTIAYVERLQNAIKQLTNTSIIEQAEKLFANDYLAKLSDNPQIQNNLISVFDGFHSTSWFDAWVGDLQDSGNAFVQVLTKNVMADIRAKELQARRTVDIFNKEIDKIFADAKAAGVNLSFDDIIDADGRFIRPYNDNFENDLNKLRQDERNAKSDIINNPEAYVEAKHKLDKFLLDHVNRKFVDSYYQELYDAQDELYRNHRPILEEYVKTKAMIDEINASRIDGTLSPEKETELKNLWYHINDIRSEYDLNNGEPKESFIMGYPGMNPTTGEIVDKEAYHKARINNAADCKALDNYLKAVNDIRNKYNDSKVRKGFEDQLKRMLDIVETAESRDPSGRISVPASQLEMNKEYKAAKAWLATNAKWTVNPEIQEAIHEAYKTMGYKGENNNKLKAYLRKLKATNVNPYDEFGRLDGTLFTEEQQAAIQEEAQKRFNNTKYGMENDRILISNGPEDDVVYPTEVYKRLAANGVPNKEYQQIVKQVNEILAPHYDIATKHVATSELTEEELDKLYQAYQPLFAGMKKTEDSTNGKSIAYFVTRFVDLDNYNHEAFNLEEERAKAKGAKYYKAWERVNKMGIPKLDDNYQVATDASGNIVYDETKDRIPNRYLYGTLKVDMDKYLKTKGKKKAEQLRKQMDERTEAYRTIHNNLETVNTPYYEAELKKQRAKGDAEFKKWYDRNHVFNPYTHKMEPTVIWRKTQIIPSIANGEWNAGYAQTELAPKAAYQNSNYKEGVGYVDNYKKTTDTTYDSNVVLNKYQQKLMSYIQQTLNTLAQTESAKRFVGRGYLPSMSKGAKHDAKWWGKQFLEFLGYSDKLQNGRDPFYHINYADDKAMDMPMLMEQLRNKDSVNIENIKKTKPQRISYINDEEYNAALAAYNKRMDEALKKNKEIHRALLNRDYRTVLSNFITQAAHFNAIQDNKYMLYYGKEMIDRMEVYQKNVGWSNLKKDHQRGARGEIRYLTQKDERLQGQYENWIRRIIYNQFKESNANFTKISSLLQSFTSAKFMMLNITGGIGNVTVGESGLAGEWIAKEFIGAKDYALGKALWMHNSWSFINDLGKDKASTLASAIVKEMNVIDFDQLAGISDGNHLDAGTAFEKLRNALYSPNAIGEHFMQNAAMFSLMYSNRIVPVVDAESRGKIKYRAMSKYEYIADCHEKALKKILEGTEFEAKFNNYVGIIKEDANKLKEFVFGRKNFTTEFARTLPNKMQKEFVKAKKELEKTATAEFEKYSRVIDNLDLKDGRLSFKEGSKLAELDALSADKEVSDAYKFLGEFKGKVISVNKEIHGVYDKLGAAQLEKHWWGSLAMQYHKHIYPGILKHYRRQGYFNEERGAFALGCGPALMDFLSMPLDKIKADREINGTQLGALQTLQKLFMGYVDMATNFNTNWNMLPRYQRAAILRAMGNVAGSVSAIAMSLAAHAIWDDKELENSTLGNLLIYEADSLATQVMMYTPPFIVTEGKKLYSSPIAAQTMPSDVLKAMNIIAEGLIAGDDYDWNYTSGRYSGENKLFVLGTRQIPVYRAYSNIVGLDKSNSYYKLGDNILGIIPTNINK